jgi:hypothetical protein
VTRKPRPPKPPVHLRVREDNQIGFVVQYVALCNFKSYRRGEVSKSMKAVTCAACIVRVRAGIR